MAYKGALHESYFGQDDSRLSAYLKHDSTGCIYDSPQPPAQLSAYQTTMSECASSSSLALATPDLLYKIFDYLSDDLTRLLRVSRMFFSCVSPTIWKSISGVSKLLTLIPGSKITTRKRITPRRQIRCDDIVSKILRDPVKA
jgi:hypothetical protein